MPVRASGAGEQQERAIRANESGHRGMSAALSEATDREERFGDKQQARIHQAIGAWDTMQERKVQQGNFDKQLSLDAAKHGLEWQAGGDRQQQVEQEMAKGAQQPSLTGQPSPDQQRFQEQSDKPLEYGRAGGEGRWVQTQGAQLAAQQGAEFQAYEAETRRMNAESSMVSAQSKMMEAAKAKNAGDKVAYANLTDDARKSFNKPTENWMDAFDKFTSGELDPGKAEALFGMQGKSDPKLGAALEEYRSVNGDTSAMTPENRERFNAAWNSKIQMESLKSIVASDGMMSPYLDLGGPIGQAFSQQMGQAEQLFGITSAMENDARAATGMSGPGYFKTYDDKQRFLRSYAARMVFMQFQVGGTDGPRAAAPGGQNGGVPIGEGPESGARYGATSPQPESQPSWTEQPEGVTHERRGGKVVKKSTPDDAKRVRAGTTSVSPGPVSDLYRNRMGF